MADIPASEKWDHTVENGMRKFSVGFAAGLLPSILFARSLTARLGIVMFCAGVGTGVAYNEGRYLFDHNITFDQRHFAILQPAGAMLWGEQTATK